MMWMWWMAILQPQVRFNMIQRWSKDDPKMSTYLFFQKLRRWSENSSNFASQLFFFASTNEPLRGAMPVRVFVRCCNSWQNGAMTVQQLQRRGIGGLFEPKWVSEASPAHILIKAYEAYEKLMKSLWKAYEKLMKSLWKAYETYEPVMFAAFCKAFIWMFFVSISRCLYLHLLCFRNWWHCWKLSLQRRATCRMCRGGICDPSELPFLMAKTVYDWSIWIIIFKDFKDWFGTFILFHFSVSIKLRFAEWDVRTNWCPHWLHILRRFTAWQHWCWGHAFLNYPTRRTAGTAQELFTIWHGKGGASCENAMNVHGEYGEYGEAKRYLTLCHTTAIPLDHSHTQKKRRDFNRGVVFQKAITQLSTKLVSQGSLVTSSQLMEIIASKGLKLNLRVFMDLFIPFFMILMLLTDGFSQFLGVFLFYFS